MKTSTRVAIAVATTLIASAITSQGVKADISMDVSSDEGYNFLTVPDTDTTQSAYGGRLRNYDVHVAKMFEMTYYYCQQSYGNHTYRWRYSASNGKVGMGEFHISCRLASDIATAYGLGKPEYTPTSGRPINVPTLNITGGKIDQWMHFTRNFTPMRGED